jgi:recombinational DNA repair ATPase RecF
VEQTAYLRSITVEGFRGVGRPARLDLVPGPGLTLVIGRNGSGKSSFAEALEQLLTGETFRWAHRTKEWQGGWRNLHHATAAASKLSESR